MQARADRPSSGWKLVLLCFLAQNLAMGLAYGSFGPLLASTEQHFGITRTVATTGISLITLAIGGLSPLLGGLMQRVPVRSAMIGGALLSALGYWGLAVLPSFPLALLMYGLIGTGVSLTAILGPLTLINRWFTDGRAKLLGIVNLPIVLFATPFLVAELLPVVGRLTILGAMGTIFLVLIPLLLLIEENPSREVPRGSGAAPVAQPASTERLLSTRELLSSPPFWLLSLAIGVMAGSGTAFVVHIVPFGMERDMTLQSASGLLSTYAGAGIIGTLLFGTIADRIGPPSALVLTTFCQALLWWGLLHVTGAPLYLLAGLLGICVVPLTTLHGAALSELVGPANISRAMGVSYAIKLPFIFTFAPFVSFLFDRAGGYRVPFLVTSATLVVACLFFLMMVFAVRKQGRSSEAVAL
jgi:MFS family permease